MKANLKTNLILFFFLVLPVFVKAEVKLPAIFADNMVLQQQTEAALWGLADKNTEITVITSWDNKIYSTSSDRAGNWKLNVSTPVAGGPYSITISDGQEITLSNVLIGEVWVCSGQSNMQMPMLGYRNQPVQGANKAIVTSENNSIRLMTVERATNIEPQFDFKGEWLECNPQTVAEFSATAYYFGRLLQDVLNVPVGLICSSWGGTPIEPWMSENELKEYDWVKLYDENSTKEFNQYTPTSLFNAMINPMAGFAIKGVIWYQGEANLFHPKEYEKLMPGLIQNWRNEWGIGDFSFYYAQIAPYNYGISEINSAMLREAQFKASDDLPNIGMACLLDVGEKHCIHPADKETAGERLAFFALAKTYDKKGFAYSGPVLKEMIIEGSLVRLTFEHAEFGLTSFGKKLENFKVAGEDKKFYPAEAIITSEGITLTSPRVSIPVAVRYAFDDFVVGDLFNTYGLPASSFRTDDWEK